MAVAANSFQAYSNPTIPVRDNQGGRTMKTLTAMLFIGLLAGCATTPDGRWEQAGKADAESKDDFDHCEKVSMLESQRNKSDAPFMESTLMKQCMERLGYTYVKRQP
jgi:hypothetical protein